MALLLLSVTHAEVIQDLTRLLRREDKHSKHSYLRQLGVIQVYQKVGCLHVVTLHRS
jgi:hypothetical protein